MSANGLDVFDKTLQTTNIWLNELMQEIGSDRQVAWHVLGTVLKAIRDRIPLELAVHLGSQLPLLVRGIYYDQWHAPGRMDEKPRSLDAFLEPIGQRLAQIRPMNARTATRAVFQILSRHVSQGQVAKVRHALPEEVRTIWHDSPEVRVKAERYGARGGAGNGSRVAPLSCSREEAMEMAHVTRRSATIDVVILLAGSLALASAVGLLRFNHMLSD